MLILGYTFVDVYYTKRTAIEAKYYYRGNIIGGSYKVLLSGDKKSTATEKTL